VDPVGWTPDEFDDDREADDEKSRDQNHEYGGSVTCVRKSVVKAALFAMLRELKKS